MKALKIFLPIFLILLAILSYVNRPQVNGDTVDKILIFTTETCPHCDVVKEHVFQNSLDQKLPIVFIDVANSTNSELLKQKAVTCNIDTAGIGVPMYFYQDQCFMGDQPIIDQLNKMLQ